MENSYELDTLDVTNPAPRCPVVLLLDTSSSMAGAPIDELNKGLKQFLRETAADEAASRSVEVEVISLGTPVKVIVPFTVLDDLSLNQELLSAGGAMSMEEGVHLALRDLKARRNMYHDNGIFFYRPLVILMTACDLNDNSWRQAADELHSLSEHGEIQYICTEIGDDADHDALRRIIPPQSGPVEHRDVCFRQLFNVPGHEPVNVVSDQDTVRFHDIRDWEDLFLFSRK